MHYEVDMSWNFSFLIRALIFFFFQKLGCSSVVEGFPRICKSPGLLPGSIHFLNKLDNKILYQFLPPKFGDRAERVLARWHQSVCLAMVRLNSQCPYTKCHCSLVIKAPLQTREKGGDHSISSWILQKFIPGSSH